MPMDLSRIALFKTECYINGNWVVGDTGATLAVKNPATGEVIAEVAKVGAKETRRAIVAAETAMSDWRQVPAKQRASVLRNWFNLIIENQEGRAHV